MHSVFCGDSINRSSGPGGPKLGWCGSRRPHLILIDDKVLSAHEQAARPVGAARHGHEHVGAVVHRLAPLAHHVVQPQVQLV